MKSIPLHARLQKWVAEKAATCRFCYHQRQTEKRYPQYEFPYKGSHKGERIYVLANGPSLMTEIEQLEKLKAPLNNSLVVNSFACTNIFETIKPLYYCLADPVFFEDGVLRDNVQKVYDSLNEKVSWPLTLFVWVEGVSNVRKIITNKNITIQGITILQYEGSEKGRFESYKKGLSVPSFVNVVIMGLYALLNLGYSEILLYGVDHTFLKDLCVDDENQLCINDHHFYGTHKYAIPPRPNGMQWKMKDYVYDKYLTFKEHEIMSEYADYLGAKVINCTEGSWIDAYTRLSQISNNKNSNI